MDYSLLHFCRSIQYSISGQQQEAFLYEGYLFSALPFGVVLGV